MLLSAAMMLLAPQGTACAFNDQSGTVSFSTTPTPRFEAKANPAAFAGGKFKYAGANYVAFGQPRQMAPMEVEAFGEVGVVPIFMAAGSMDDTTVFVMVDSAKCVFQWYEKK